MKKISVLIIILALSVSILSAGSSIVGDMNSWNPADPTYDLTENVNGVWVLTKTLGGGDYEYKVVEGDDWSAPNYPVNGQTFTLAEESAVTWKVNLDDDLVTHCNPVVAGNFISELGGTDWDPADLTGEMTDFSANDIYEWQVLVPAGDWEYKVTLNHNWDQSTGGNISFSSNGVDQIRFSYDMSNNTTSAIALGAPEVSSVEQYQADKVDVNFNTTMDISGGVNSANNSSNYSINSRISIDSVTVVSNQIMRLNLNLELTGGTEYIVTVDTTVESSDGVAMNPGANTGSFTSFVYAPITFIVDDYGGQTYAGFYLKGSWNDTGQYDSGWGGGVEHSAFYDDGTHGDVTANDHIWTVSINLVCDDSINTWKWGINDTAHQWVAGNWQFWVPDGDPQTLTHTIPYGISQDVTVTFQVYMGILDTAWYNNGVSVQGSPPLNWSAGSNMLSDADDDSIYTGEILFPEGTTPEVEFKFTRCDNDGNWEWETFTGNRTFTIDDSSPTQTLAWVFWSNDVPEPQNVIINISGTDAEISWDDVYGATDYKVLRDTIPDGNFSELGTTGGSTNYTDTDAGSETKYFYKIKAIRN